ncbi:hypothetical protein MSG28_014890 [Choristoneura fumiferana]|uniref:Uncharacterized protein n=1 Tax=Choristoneura fumiferana TaxID=7141 RepID=A0ACC0KYH5_CHOFU|nr:hypothetical protein MSG28_014890 [Choristoneura fumiferana]
MDRFCRGCLVRYDEPAELIQYTEKNRRLFVYSTGLQVKRNDAFTFQLCKDCYLNMKVACSFKKQCRGSDKKLKSYLALKDMGETMDLSAYLKNNDDSWMYRFPMLYGSSTPHQKPKEDDTESSSSIRNFMTDIMPETDLLETEARIIKEVIEEDADVLDESLDSHWLQDDVSIDTNFKLDFSQKENGSIYETAIEKLKVVDDIINHKIVDTDIKLECDDNLNNIDKIPEQQCIIDKNLEEALKNSNNNEFFLDELLVSPQVIPGIKTPPTPLINNILFGEKLDMGETSNSEHKYAPGNLIESYEDVICHIENYIDVKMDDLGVDENKTESIVEDTQTGACNCAEISSFSKIKGYAEQNPNLKHKIMLIKPQDFECEECKLQFSSETTLRKHKAAHSGQALIKIPNVKKFICTECAFSCDKASNFKIHMKRHEKTFSFTCTECGKGYYRRSELVIHMRYHTGETPFKCTFCDRGYPRRDALTRHIKANHLDNHLPVNIAKVGS